MIDSINNKEVIGGDGDDFAIRLRRDELEAFMMEIADPIFGQCKVYIHDGYPSTLDMDADIEDFFTYNDEWGLVEYCIYVPYSEDYKKQGEALVDTLKSRHYTLSGLNILFVEEEVYPQTGRERGIFGELPEGYRFRLHSGHYDKWRFEWIENTGLTHMTEKYGDMFKMELDGTIICTDPEYQDWTIIIDNNTKEKYLDNRQFAKVTNSETLKATAADCISDAAATGAVLLSTIIGHVTGWQIDGYCGAVVSGFIMIAGIKSLWEVLGRIMGQNTDQSITDDVLRMIEIYPEIAAVQNLMVHPNRER